MPLLIRKVGDRLTRPQLEAAKYLPGGTLRTLVQGGTDGLPWGAAAGVVVITGSSPPPFLCWVFMTRDIVASTARVAPPSPGGASKPRTIVRKATCTDALAPTAHR
jgi:hypothetical protein